MMNTSTRLIHTFSIVAYDPSKKRMGRRCTIKIPRSGSGCFLGQGKIRSSCHSVLCQCHLRFKGAGFHAGWHIQLTNYRQADDRE